MTTIHTSFSRTDRLDFRLEGAQKSVIEKAAALLGLNVSQFAVATLLEKARSVVDAHEVTMLSNRDRDAFLALLDEDAKPNLALRKAARRYKAYRKGLRGQASR